MTTTPTSSPNLLRIGFTGNRSGMTSEQRATIQYSIERWYTEFDDIQVHHGDCLGADADMHGLAFVEGLYIIVHPPDNDAQRAFTGGYNEIRDPKPYLKRNHDIVNESDILISCPANSREVLRSGTWATIRYAAKNLGNDRTWIILPDGSVRQYNMI